MKSGWLPSAVLRAASLVTPGAQRADWLKEWRSELWYVPRRQAMRFSVGAFRDALWLRRNNGSPVKRPRTLFESPLSCLASMTALAALSILVTTRLQTMLPFPQANGVSALHGFADLLLLYFLLAGIALLIGDGPATRRMIPRAGKLRNWVFLATKILLALPILQCVLVAIVVIDVPLLPLGFFTAYVQLFRWVFTDQQRRCPVCLRLLSKPVRIGTPSQTFLSWYGAESMCLRGHGVLHVSETSSSYSERPQWLRLDESWSGLFR